MKKLHQYGIWFYGPYSPELFELIYAAPPAIFTDVFIGAGESKAVAAMRALSHIKGRGWSSCFDLIEDEVKRALPSHSTTVEGDERCSIYCVLALEDANAI